MAPRREEAPPLSARSLWIELRIPKPHAEWEAQPCRMELSGKKHANTASGSGNRNRLQQTIATSTRGGNCRMTPDCGLCGRRERSSNA